MTDIVERTPLEVMELALREAAAEIERLAEWREIAKRRWIELTDARAEIKRMQWAIERADRLVLACEQHLRDAKHEITKLRDDLRDNGIIR